MHGVTFYVHSWVRKSYITYVGWVTYLPYNPTLPTYFVPYRKVRLNSLSCQVHVAHLTAIESSKEGREPPTGNFG